MDNGWNYTINIVADRSCETSILKAAITSIWHHFPIIITIVLDTNLFDKHERGVSSRIC